MNGNILIVDDESAVLKLLKDILTAEGHVVRPFNNGELALRSIMVEAPELIILDIRMPGMTGFEICRHIKEDERLKEIPVIFISAASDMEDKLRAFQAGGVDYITKPFQKEEVIARIKTHIELSHTIQSMKRLSEELRKSEESLKLAQTIAHLGHWEWDLESDQFTCSEEMYRILGLEAQEPITNHNAFLQAVHPDDREIVANHLREVKSGNNFDIEYRVILQQGEVRVVHGKGEVFWQDASKRKIIGTIQHLRAHDQMKMLGVIQDVTEQKQLQNKLEEQANTDYLTGCNSRRYFLRNAEQEFSRIRRYGGEMSILMLDLDHFKNINDQYGHQVGDIALKKLVAVCQGLMRDVDVIGRLGGEEFAIMLPKTGGGQALEVAERLCRAVAEAEILLNDAMSILHFTTSIGVASATKDDKQVDDIINRSDNALYKAKHAGRNRVCVWCS